MPIVWTGRTVAGVVAVGLTACGGSATPTAPGPVPQPQYAVQSVAVTGTPAFLFVGRSLPLTATITFANGTTAGAKKVAWAVDPAGVASVSPSGVLSGLAPGLITVTATLDGAVGSSHGRVLPDVDGHWTGPALICACHGAWCGRYEPFTPGTVR
jgi:hypothetical protein